MTKFAVPAASSTVRLLIETCGAPEGASLSMIVAVAEARAMVALALGEERFISNNSVPSATALSTTCTRTVLTVSPGAKVSAPETGMKSE